MALPTATGHGKTTFQNLVVLQNLACDGRVGANGVTPPAQAAHIADPSGGGTQDAEARTAINAILVVLENLGFTATS